MSDLCRLIWCALIGLFRYLRHLLNSYQKYYNEARTHLSLQKDAPRVPSRLSVARERCQFWVDCTINTLERKFPTRTRDTSRLLAYVAINY